MPKIERRLNTTLVPTGRCTPLDGPRENTTRGS